MRNKGFTLVELLAVIVVLAIILAVSIPSITGIIQSSTKSAFASDANIVLKQLDYEKMLNSSFDVTSINAGNINNLGLSNDNYKSLSVSIKNGKPYIVIVGKNKWNGLTVCGTFNNMQVANTENSSVCENIAVNAPVLATGMIPIRWDGTTWIDTTAGDSDWYSYIATDKKWANARTADGSMWVWIPRYIYKISSGWHSNTTGTIEVQFSKGTDDDWNSSIIGNIDTGTTANASNNKWTNHPAFWWDNDSDGVREAGEELTGIWVAKFEASGTTNAIDFKPNVSSLRSITIDNMFTASRNMEANSRYGWGLASGLKTDGTFITDTNNVDTHIMKNSEWGAVAYLSKSIYGINSEIYKNNSSGYYTGRSGGNVGGSQVKVGGNENIDTGFYTYDGKCASTITLAPGINANCTTVGNTVSDTSLSYNASTTGNIYGIYDMSGGTYEYVAAYVNNGNSNLTTFGNSIITANAKYKEVYTVTTDDKVTNYSNSSTKKGDALYETSGNTNGPYSWYSDYSNMPYTNLPYFVRGDSFANNADVGVFNFNNNSGGGGSGFRGVVLVGTGL